MFEVTTVHSNFIRLLKYLISNGTNTLGERTVEALPVYIGMNTLIKSVVI